MPTDGWRPTSPFLNWTRRLSEDRIFFARLGRRSSASRETRPANTLQRGSLMKFVRVLSAFFSCVACVACGSSDEGAGHGGSAPIGFGGANAASSGGTNAAQGGNRTGAGGKISASGGTSAGSTASNGGAASGGNGAAHGGTSPGSGGANSFGGASARAGAGGISGTPPAPGSDGLSPYKRECHGDSLDCGDPALRCLGLRDASGVLGYSCSNRCDTVSDCSSASAGTDAPAGCLDFVNERHCLLVCQDESGQKACPTGMSCYVYPGTTLGYCLWR